MAQLDYFATFEESIKMLEDIFKRGDIRAYVGRVHDTPHPKAYKNVSGDFIRDVFKHPMVHLAGSFSTHPVRLQQQTEGKNAGKWLLFDSDGGPTIGLSISERFKDGNLAMGVLLSQPGYELTEGHYMKAPPEVREAFVDVSKRMKKHLVRYKQAMWIGPEALRLFEAGKAFVGDVQLQAIARYDAEHPESTRRIHRKTLTAAHAAKE